MSLTRRLALAVPLLWSCFGCGPASEGEGSGGTTSSGTSSASAASSESGALACEDYVSADAVGPEVTVTVRHTGTTPVYFKPEGCGGTLTFEITALATDETVPYTLGECTPVLCDDFLVLDDCSQGCSDCAPPESGRFEAGGMAEGEWSGAWLVPLTMTNACASGAGCASECQRRDAAPPGRYQIALTTYQLCAGSCECDPPMPEGGVCNLYGGTQLGYPQTFVAEIDYPAQTVAEIVITD